MGFTAKVDGFELESVTEISPLGGANPYHFRSWDFTADNDEVLLEIVSEAAGDATLLVDAVTVIPIGEDHVNIANASFEASDIPPSPGYINPDGLAGWTGTGGYGVNFTGAGPFADNGINSDQDLVAFIQGKGSLSQTLTGLLNGQNYNLKVAVNARSGNAPILRISAGENIIYDEAVEPVGGTEPYEQVEANFVAEASTVDLKFEQIAEGDNTVLLDNVTLVGEAVNIPPVSISIDEISLPAGTANGSFVITIPELLTMDEDAVIKIISQNPEVASPVGAEEGALTLTYQQGGDLEKTIEIIANSRGNTTFLLEGPNGVSFNPSTIQVSVITSLVRNPSFESNYNSTFPSYSPIASWVDGDSGNQGVNEANGPFHDNGIIPDRGRVGFIQTSNSLHQDIVGLTPGQSYLLEFYYNARSYGSENIVDMSINFNEEEVDTILDINPVGEDAPYNYARYVVTATEETARLEFVTNAQGDATVLLDAVSLSPAIEGQILLANSSFEASGIVKQFPGYIQPAPIAGWMMAGSYGVNVSGEGPFADNGSNPDQDLVLFLQGADSSASQVVSGLSEGESYIIEVAANARVGNIPSLDIAVNDSSTLRRTITPVEGANPYHSIITGFTANSDTAVIKLSQVAEGDQTVLLDLVKVYPGLPPQEAPELIIRGGEDSVALSWDTDADNVELLSAPSIDGPWTVVTLPAVENNGLLTVTVATSQEVQFFKLITAE